MNLSAIDEYFIKSCESKYKCSSIHQVHSFGYSFILANALQKCEKYEQTSPLHRNLTENNNVDEESADSFSETDDFDTDASESLATVF